MMPVVEYLVSESVGHNRTMSLRARDDKFSVKGTEEFGFLNRGPSLLLVC